MHPVHHSSILVALLGCVQVGVGGARLTAGQAGDEIGLALRPAQQPAVRRKWL